MSSSEEDFEFGQAIRRPPSVPIKKEGAIKIKAKAPMFNPNSSESPKQIDEKRFKWWADEAGVSLTTALERALDEAAIDLEACEHVKVKENATCISRQISKQISELVYSDLVGSLRGHLKMIENACQAALWENRTSPSDNDTVDDIASNAKLDQIITKQIPQEISRILAYKIFTQIIGELDDDEIDHISIVSSGTDDYETAFPRNTSDVRLNNWSNHSKIPNVRSSDSLASATSEPTGQAAKHHEESSREHTHRKFYHDNNDAALQLDAYKKFCMVLVNGRGFRVVKHNHGGGRNNRILQYNPTKNRIVWGSNKVLGAEYLDCSRISRVKREEVVVYVWHTTGKENKDKKKKKMVGFETQREYDARVLELALLYLQSQSGST